MKVRDILSHPDRYLGCRVTVEGSVHLSTLNEQIRCAWVCDTTAGSNELSPPDSGLLLRYPGMMGRFVPVRSGPVFPLIGFECEALLVKSDISPWKYALVDFSSARYFQRPGDSWCVMNLDLLPGRQHLVDIIGAVGYSDEERADYILKLLRRMTD